MLALQLTAEARDDAIAQLGIFRKLVGNVAKKSVAIGRRDRRVPCQYEAWLSCQYEAKNQPVRRTRFVQAVQ
jgi:hypothetical protein